MELFELLVLVLLVAVVALLALVFVNLSALKRTLEEDGSRAGFGTPGGAALGEGTGSSSGGFEGRSDSALGYGSDPGSSQPQTAQQPSYAGGGSTGQQPAYGSATEPAQAAQTPARETGSEYAAWSEGAGGAGGSWGGSGGGAGAATQTTGQSSPAAAQQEELPEEQPFERDGRWWFKRGDELLIYDEQAGQWVAAPPGSSPGSVAAASQPGYAGGQAGTGGAGGGTGLTGAAAGGGWRCPSCGAMNGSADASCRMCFAARP